MLSQFLPEDFNPQDKLAVLAGKGVYPQILVEKLRKLKIPTCLMALEGETAPELIESFDKSDVEIFNIGQLGRLLKELKKHGAANAMMAGQITPKKLFKGLKLDLKAMMILATLKRRNAETIFGAIADQMAKIGVRLLDARCFLDDCIAPKGFFCGKKWNISQSDLEHGMTIAREMARLDVGQGCVVSHGSVLAVEAWEGTDKMLERAGEFEAKDCLFAKTVKPNQDYRFDVPVIGERTVRKLAASHIENVAVEAGKVIILEKEKVAALANQNNIKIYGI